MLPSFNRFCIAYNAYLFPSKVLAKSILYLNTMDIGLPAPSLSGVNFMPSSPPLDASRNTNCQPDPKDGPSLQYGDLNYQFMEMATKKQGNCLLTPLKHSDYWHYLNNRKSTNYHGSLAERWRQAHDKHQALSFFELKIIKYIDGQSNERTVHGFNLDIQLVHIMKQRLYKDLIVISIMLVSKCIFSL